MPRATLIAPLIAICTASIVLPMIEMASIDIASISRAGDLPPADGDAATQPTSKDSPASVRLQNLQMIRDEFNPLPKLPAAKIADVVHIALDGGHLHVTNAVQPGIEAAVPVTDWAGSTRVNAGPPGSLIFHLKHVRLLDDNLTMENTEVFTQPDYLQIVRDTETQTGLHNVTLLQSRQYAGPGGTPIRVLIHDTPNDGPDTSKTLNAESFEKLRQAEPAELRRELLPLLKDLGAADLMQTVRPDAAWQVLGGDVSTSPQLAGQIDGILQNLSADDFTTRSQAEATLASLGAPAAAALARRDLSTLQPDPRAAVDNFLHRTQKLDAANAGRLARDPEFLLDVAAGNFDPRLNAVALKHLSDVTGKTLDLRQDISVEQRQASIDAFRTALVPTTQR